MKISSAAVLALSCLPSTVAFVATSGHKSVNVNTELNLQKEQDGKNSWVGPAMTGLAGLTLASQMAVASMPPTEIDVTPIVVREDSTMQMNMATISETSPYSAISGSTLQLAAETNYLDFAMPSYGDSVTSSSKAKASENAAAPVFSNPFGDFSSKKDEEAPAAVAAAPDTSAEDKAATEAAKQAQKEEAAAAKQAEREEAAQQKAEEKADREAEKQAAADAKAADKQAAADKKVADEAAAADKKAEKEARRVEQKEKQRLAVERAKEESSAAVEATSPAISLPDVKIPEFKAPDFSGFKAPDIKAPDFSGFKAPEVKAPEVKTQDYNLDIPDIKLPEVSLPKFSMPKIPDMPKMPDMPKVDTSSISTPSFSVPKASTNFEAPKVPSFSTPSFSSSSSSGGYALDDVDVAAAADDQEERDVAAKDARTGFNQADASAQEFENKAKQLRAVANDKKRIAKDAKDEACKTRFGGKVLCIRPFGIGY